MFSILCVLELIFNLIWLISTITIIIIIFHWFYVFYLVFVFYLCSSLKQFVIQEFVFVFQFYLFIKKFILFFNILTIVFFFPWFFFVFYYHHHNHHFFYQLILLLCSVFLFIFRYNWKQFFLSFLSCHFCPSLFVHILSLSLSLSNYRLNQSYQFIYFTTFFSLIIFFC